MNRLRAAYVAIDPSIRHHLVTGWTDDTTGIDRTYAMGVHRTWTGHFLASAFVFVGSVNVVVAAGLGAVLADALGASGLVTTLLGATSALLYAGLVVLPAHRAYQQAHPGTKPDHP
jgi:hypothetical protein